MKYFFKRYGWLITTLFVGLSLLGWLSYSGRIKYEIFFGGVIALLTLFISIINYYQTNDKFFKELFTEFNCRYDRMNNYLNSISGEDNIKEINRQKIIDYLILCSEEYMWVKKGRIPSDVWKSWSAGIMQHISKPAIRKVYNEERKQDESYYGLFNALDKVLK